jgi:hypothetical protein
MQMEEFTESEALQKFREDVKKLEDYIRAQKLKLKEEKILLRAREVEEQLARVGQGTHTRHARGIDHYASKPWDVWELTDRSSKEYTYVGRFGSIGEIAKVYNKNYYSVWQMKNRWEKLKENYILNPNKRSILLRIEPVI